MAAAAGVALAAALSASAPTWVLATLAATTLTTARIVLAAAPGVARARIPASRIFAALLTLARLWIVSHFAFPFPSYRVTSG